MTAASVPRREVPIRWIGLAALALLLVIFLSQMPFFFAWGAEHPLGYAFNYGWVLVLLVVATAWTRTVPLRLLAAAWFVGAFPVTGLILLLGLPLLTAFGYEHAVLPGFVLPLMEELIKPIPILLLFWWSARRGLWQLTASDGALVGFMIGAGLAFHEDMMFGRVQGAGPGATPLSWIFPTLHHSTGLTAYHDTLLALVGLAIGAAFMLRNRTRFAWLIPVGAWVIAFTEHWTWNYSVDPAAGEPFLSVASALRTLLVDGALVPVLLAAGIIAAVVAERRIETGIQAKDRLFAPASAAAMLRAAQAGVAGWRRLQAQREYARRLRSAHYALWTAGPAGLPPPAVTALVEELAQRAAADGVRPPATAIAASATLGQPPAASGEAAHA